VNTALTGRTGEDLAAEYLKNCGWTILTRNFRTKSGEVDIIGLDGDNVVFVEVKFWPVFSLGDLEYSINPKKRRKIIRVSREYLARNTALDGKNVRYDVVFSRGAGEKWEHFSDVFTET
jgi:putative endonuclease